MVVEKCERGDVHYFNCAGVHSTLCTVNTVHKFNCAGVHCVHCALVFTAHSTLCALCTVYLHCVQSVVLTGGGEVESEVYNSTSVQDGGGLHFTSLCTLFPCAQCALCVQSVELTGGGECTI